MLQKKYILFTYLLFFLIILTFYILQSKTENKLNIYSGRKSELIHPLIKNFENKYNIKVNITTGKADEFIQRLKLEGTNTQADILLTTDIARLTRAKNNNLFKTVESKILKKNIPPKYVSKDNDWFGFSIRARPIIYSKERVKVNELSSYEKLKDKKWNKRICMRSSNNVYNQSLIASMIINIGEEKTNEWIKGLVKNFSRKPYGGDRDQIRAIASGECDITIANTYYLANMLNGKNKYDKIAAEKVSVFWPNRNNFGTHINISGAGIIKGSKNFKNAVNFLEFLSSKEAQKIYTKEINEYSIRADVKPSKIVSRFGNFTADDLKLNKIAENIETAIYLATKNKWR